MEERKDPREELHPQEDTSEAAQEDMQEEFREYSFLQETIKRDRRGERKGFFRMAGLGLVFGVFACFSFSAMKPAMDSIFQDDPQKVTIPQEEESQEEEEQAPPPVEEVVQPPLDADSYRQMQQSLTTIGVKANRSVVEIAGVLEDQDWTEESKDYKNSVSGLIVADNGRELLVLGKSSVAKDAKELKIVFNNGQAYPATLKKSDGNLGFGVYAVNRSDIQDSTWAQIDTAVLGSSNAVSKGDIAIVLGKPFGYAGAMGFGSIASGKNTLDSADGQYRLINTDIAGSKNGSGFIVNLKGEIIALIDQSAAEEGSTELIIGYGITDVKDVIEFLSNGQGVPYIGIWGVDVTEEIEEQGIPKGLYVKNVDADSPAMAAGIQSGDVITGIDDVEITSYGIYHGTLMEKKVGSEAVIKGQRQGADGYVDIDFKVTVGSKEM
ncbi:PDZ domain-containing protein [Lachnospiraceae bacterium WCA-9-b2]|jgi:serine protease Do|uniref:PDZ domain-containing protein n=1 Tax=Sporofaciens musculi TaxID=2681861 RepID=A0A7X3MHL8_9FIRM|nr:S1C family serine protease [Sporofaciens musculi]MCI9423150.1 serine protease [Dorea sp.]MXP76593.1 PDZ domain-containing protein [Sporofaciens musculi]